MSLLVFELDGDRYALYTEVVREVTRAVAMAPLPQAPDVAEGVIDVRGELVPMLDVRRRFGKPGVPVRPDQHFIIAHPGRVVGLRVDAVRDILEVEPGAIESPDRVPEAERVAGVARLPDGLVVIHDLGAFLELEEAGRLHDAVDAAEADR